MAGQQAAQDRDPVADLPLGGGRRVAVPDGPDQRRQVDGPVGVQQQRGQDALARHAVEVQEAPVRAHLQRSQHPVVHPFQAGLFQSYIGRLGHQLQLVQLLPHQHRYLLRQLLDKFPGGALL